MRLVEIEKIFADNKFHHLPVVENRKLVGIVSDRDVLRAGSPFRSTDKERDQDKDSSQKQVHKFMTRYPKTISRETSVQEAAGLMIKHRISSLPVVTPEGRLEGIVTWRDFLRCFIA